MRAGSILLVCIIIILGLITTISRTLDEAWSTPGNYPTEGYVIDHQTYQWTQEITQEVQGMELAIIKTVNGTIHFHPQSGGGEPRLEAKAVIRIKPSWFSTEEKVLRTKSAVGVIVEQDNDSITLRAVFPKWRFGGSRENVSVDFEVTAPPSLNLRCETVNGTVSAEATEGNAHLSTVNGSVKVKQCRGAIDASCVNGRIEIEDAEQRVKAHTTNGSIQAVFMKLPEEKTEFHTVNGSIAIACPFPAAFDADFQTVNGRVDLGSQAIEGTVKKNSAKGKVNGGGPAVEAHTVNGGIKLTEHK